MNIPDFTIIMMGNLLSDSSAKMDASREVVITLIQSHKNSTTSL